MKGKRIKTLQQLAKAAQERKSVVGWLGAYGNNYMKPKPAAFVLNMSAAWVLTCINIGLYTYHPERKKKAPAVRNPEGIDFNKHPIPDGYTVASEKDCRLARNDCGWMFFADRWFLNNESSASSIQSRWTYLRPLRRGEKVVSV